MGPTVNSLFGLPMISPATRYILKYITKPAVLTYPESESDSDSVPDLVSDSDVEDGRADTDYSSASSESDADMD